MLNQLWRTDFDSGVIDTHVDRRSKSLAIGMLSGEVVVVDYYGNVLYELLCEMPVWGVCHALTADGTFLTAVAEADKEGNRGAVSIYSDDSIVARLILDAPAWDTAILDDGRYVAVTDWSGRLTVMDSASGDVTKSFRVACPLFGLSGASLSNLLVCGERSGVFRYDAEADQLKLQAECISAAYNVASSPDRCLLTTGSHGPSLTIHHSDKKSCETIAARGVISVEFYDRLLLYGGFSKDLYIRSLMNLKQDLFRIPIGGEVWSISVDREEEAVFVGTGAGQVLAFHFSASGEQIRISESFLLSNPHPSAVELIAAVESGVHPTYILPAVLQLIDGDKLSKKDAVQLRLAMPDEFLCAGEVSSEIRLTLGILSLHSENFEEAADFLEGVDAGSHHYSLATVLLTRALVALDRVATASQTIERNFSRLDSAFRQRTIGVLINSCEVNGHARVLSGQLAVRHRHSPKNQPVQLSDLVADDVSMFLEDPVQGKSTRQDVDYGLINYIKYEHPSRCDHAKKILEMSVVDELMEAHHELKSQPANSLDIGCATGRWPKYFANLGFRATGYDVDGVAVGICAKIAEENERIEIELKNILASAPEPDQYSVITSMMGTFNHIPRSDQLAFIAWMHDSLRPQGMVFFSSWNPDCSFTSYLQFYKEEQRRNMKMNTRSHSSLIELLKDAGFIEPMVIPFAHHPDSCYELWMESSSDESIIAIDAACRDVLNNAQSQMMLCVGRKK